MSYFEYVCPVCGAHYMVGMVGRALIGGHDCPQTVCDPYKDAKTLKSKAAITSVLRAAHDQLGEKP